MPSNLTALTAIRMRIHEAMLLVQAGVETAETIGYVWMARNLKDARDRLNDEFVKISKEIDSLQKPPANDA